DRLHRDRRKDRHAAAGLLEHAAPDPGHLLSLPLRRPLSATLHRPRRPHRPAILGFCCSLSAPWIGAQLRGCRRSSVSSWSDGGGGSSCTRSCFPSRSARRCVSSPTTRSRV